MGGSSRLLPARPGRGPESTWSASSGWRPRSARPRTSTGWGISASKAARSCAGCWARRLRSRPAAMPRSNASTAQSSGGAAGPKRRWPWPGACSFGSTSCCAIRWTTTSSAAEAEPDRNQLYLEIYRDIAQQSEQTTRALQDYGAVGLRVHMAATLATLPTPPAFPQPDEVRALWSAATAEVIALMASLKSGRSRSARAS